MPTRKQHENPSTFPRGHESHAMSTHAAPTPVGHPKSSEMHPVGRTPLTHAAAARSTKRDDPEGTALGEYQKKLMPEK